MKIIKELLQQYANQIGMDIKYVVDGKEIIIKSGETN